MSTTVYNDEYIDWSTIDGPVDQYLYINFKPEIFNGTAPSYVNFKDVYKPIELVYNGEVQAQDLIESLLIVTQVGADGIDKAPFNSFNNPYNYNDEQNRKPWRVETISLTDPGVTVDIKYESRMTGISDIPKNVGRYDITINVTYVRNKDIIPEPWHSILNPNAPYPTHKHNGTYRGFWSSYQDRPNNCPLQGGIFTYDRPGFNIFEDTLNDTEFSHLKFETGLNNFNIYRAPYKGYGDAYKFLLITPRPVDINFTKTEFIYYGNTNVPEYITDPQILDTSDPKYPGNVPIRLLYERANDNTPAPISILAAPTEIGSYTVTAEVTDLNYTGSKTSSLIIHPISSTAAEAIAAENQEKAELFENSTSGLSGANEYTSTLGGVNSGSSLINSGYASSSEKVTAKDFIKSGVLTMLEKSDIPALGTIKTLAECAQNLPQKLMLFAAAKIAQLVLSYVPGLGILKLLTSIMQLIEQVKKIMALIEFIKDNPWGFLNAVLEASGAYAKLGSLANEKLEELKAAFPNTSAAVGDVAGFVKDVANGLVDICNNVDINGNPIATLIKADNTRVPEVVSGFNPPTSRQPIEEKARYDLFQLRLRDALYKDSEKMDAMNAAGNITGVQEYVSMLTAVHELAYNYHDRIASTGNPTGLLSGSFGTTLESAYNILGDATSILSSVYPQNTTETPATVTSTSGGKKKTAFSIDSLNSGLGAVANTISGVTAGLNSVTSFMSGETGFSLKAFKNEFNYAAKETLRKNPFWSKETISEYNKRVNRIKFEMETNAEAIRNNPANASAASAGQGLSNGASTGGIFKGSPLAGSLSSWTGGKWMS